MATRRMRRTREVATAGGEDDESSGFDLYRMQGNTNAAWSAFLSSSSATNNTEEEGGGGDSTVNEYNLLVLGYLNHHPNNNNNNSNSVETFLQQLQDFEKSLLKQHERSSNAEGVQNRYHLILTYNRALVHFASGDMERTINICQDAVQGMIQNKSKPDDILVPVLIHFAFLLLECLLATAAGRHSGFGNDTYKCPHPDAILAWLDALDLDEQDAPLKFLLTLYKGRVDLAHLDESGKHVDSKVRSARKELKTAMEVYQHKLRQCFGADTASVVSSANSEGYSSAHFHLLSSSSVLHDYQQQQRPSSTVLQKYGQSALSAKAHLEQLKGNTKKSLILCSEAQGSTKEDGTYDVFHANNLAVVYGTNGKRHLALHEISKALRASHASGLNEAPNFHNDGTVRRDTTPEILHNTAICALQAKQYVSAYECMVACISQSTMFRSRLRCWLRMAEACIGVFSQLNEHHQRNTARLVTVLNQGEASGVIMDDSILHNTMEVKVEELVTDLGSAADMEQVKRNPLLRARDILEYIISKETTCSDRDVILVAQLSLAYASLAFKDYSRALNLSTEILQHEDAGTNHGSDRFSTKRQIATARMYAAESLLHLSRTEESIKLLVGDGKDGTLDRLASDLAGVTMESAATNETAKRRVAKMEAMIRSSSSSVYSSIGDIETAKQLANSAAALEDESKNERSTARRALIYALLREGQHSSALNLLKSLS